MCYLGDATSRRRTWRSVPERGLRHLHSFRKSCRTAGFPHQSILGGRVSVLAWVRWTRRGILKILHQSSRYLSSTALSEFLDFRPLSFPLMKVGRPWPRTHLYSIRLPTPLSIARSKDSRS